MLLAYTNKTLRTGHYSTLLVLLLYLETVPPWVYCN